MDRRRFGPFTGKMSAKILLELYRHDATCIHSYVHTTFDNAHNRQAQGLNLRRGRSLGGRRTVDINDEHTDGLRS